MGMAASSQTALELGKGAVDELEAQTGLSQAMIMRTVRTVGGAMIGISVLVVVLNEVFSLDAIANSTGEFGGVIDQLTSIGGATLGLLVIGILVLGANRVMSFFGGGGM